MSRITTHVLVFLLLLNASAGMLTITGIAAELDFEPSVGGDDAIDDAEQQADDIDAGGGFGETLFGLYTSATGAFQTIANVVFHGPIMLQNLGMPTWLAGFTFGPMYVLVGLDVIYALTGRDL